MRGGYKRTRVFPPRDQSEFRPFRTEEGTESCLGKIFSSVQALSMGGSKNSYWLLCKCEYESLHEVKVTLCLSCISIHCEGLQSLTANIESSSSKPTVLGCILKNFRKRFIGDQGVKLTPWMLRKMCETDWLSFGVGWSAEGTLDIPTIRNVHKVIIRFPYLISGWV